MKDNFSTKNVLTTCASATLRDYVPPFNATVVDRLQAAGGIMLGKTNLDEFAMGSGSVDTIFGPVRNPWGYTSDTEFHIAGGSSGGSAVAVAVGASSFAIGSDTGGSVRNPAAWCGVVGFKPTYGSVSRHGLISLVNYLDVPGVFSTCVDDAALVYNAIKGHDVLDSTTVYHPLDDVITGEEESVDQLVVGIPKEYHAPGLSDEIKTAWEWAADAFHKAGAKVVQVSLPHTQYSTPCYHVLNCCEVASNFARYDGVEYGHRSPVGDNTQELYANSRHDSFNDVVKTRIIAGNYFLLEENYEKFYEKSLKVRRLIQQDFGKVMKPHSNPALNNLSCTAAIETDTSDCRTKCDVLLTPAVLTTAPLHSEFTKADNRTRCSENDVLTLAVNMAGVPAISLPVALSESSNMPIGLQLIASNFQENVLFKAARFLESRAQFPGFAS